METLLSLTSKRAGEWFKEELRELGGLEHIVKTIRECHRHINGQDVLRSGWTDPLLDKLRKVDRCLRVLENVSVFLFFFLFFYKRCTLCYEYKFVYHVNVLSR